MMRRWDAMGWDRMGWYSYEDRYDDNISLDD